MLNSEILSALSHGCGVHQPMQAHSIEILAIAAAAALGLDHPNMERLCCRVLWVAEAVARYADQYTPGKNNIPYERFMRACQMAKGMADEYELTWRRFWDDLDKLRSKLQVSAFVLPHH